MEIKIDGVLSSQDGFNLLTKEVKARVDEIKFDPTINENIAALGFDMFKVNDPKGTFDILAGVLDLDEVDEFGNLPLIEDEIVGEKGYDTVRRWGKRGMSRRTQKYLENAKAEDTQLPDFVIKDIDALTRDTERLVKRATKSKNFEMTRVLTEGLKTTVTAFGPGSAGLDGKPLFATDHPVSLSDPSLGTQSNKITGVLNKANLLIAIDLLRAMKDQNGTRIGTPMGVTLAVPSELYRTALETVSGGFSFDGSAEAANTNVPNTFLWEGYKVKIVVLETLNQPTKKGVVGDATQWFVLDEQRVRELEMFKFIYIYDNIIEFYMDPTSKVVFYDIDLEFSADHFNYLGAVGSTWTV